MQGAFGVLNANGLKIKISIDRKDVNKISIRFLLFMCNDFIRQAM